MGVPILTAKYFDFKEKMHKQFLASAYLPEPDFNIDKVLINLKNGTFELSNKTQELRKFDSADFITYQLPFDYNPKAGAPVFQKYLSRVLPDENVRQVLAEYFGYLFMRHGSNLKLEKALFLYGNGANGKSVLFEVVNALLGTENISYYSLTNLTDTAGYFRAMIENKLLNYSSEISTKMATDLFKQLVSGEPANARLPYGKPFNITTYAKFIFNANTLPRDVEQTNAFFRRFIIIPFEITIPEEDQDKTLHKKIINNELSGVLNWILQGLKRLLQQKSFSECYKIRDAVNIYKKESDTVAMYVDVEDYKKSLEETTPLKEIYRDYVSYCHENGYNPLHNKNFSKRLEALGFSKDRQAKGMVFYVFKNSMPM